MPLTREDLRRAILNHLICLPGRSLNSIRTELPFYRVAIRVGRKRFVMCTPIFERLTNSEGEMKPIWPHPIEGLMPLLHGCNKGIVKLKRLQISQRPIGFTSARICLDRTLVYFRRLLALTTVAQRVAVTDQYARIIGYTTNDLRKLWVSKVVPPSHGQDSRMLNHVRDSIRVFVFQNTSLLKRIVETLMAGERRGIVSTSNHEVRGQLQATLEKQNRLTNHPKRNTNLCKQTNGVHVMRPAFEVFAAYTLSDTQTSALDEVERFLKNRIKLSTVERSAVGVRCPNIIAFSGAQVVKVSPDSR